MDKFFLNKFAFFISLLTLLVLLQGCASSEVSRTATNDIETAYQNAGGMLGAGGTDPLQAFANSSQTTKGALIGGATGAVAGGMTSGIGVIPGAAGGAIFGGAIGAYIDSFTTFEDKIENRGGKAIVLGDQILIVLPSSKLFGDGSSQFIPYAYPTLDVVVRLINRYPNVSVKIAAYANPIGTERVNLALTQEQANNVERYLWRAGLNTRLLYAAGYGETRPVVKSTQDNAYENDRVEITLEKVPI